MQKLGEKLYFLWDKLRDRVSRDQRGATAAEYGIIIALVGLGISAALWVFRGDLVKLLGDVGTQVNKR